MGTANIGAAVPAVNFLFWLYVRPLVNASTSVEHSDQLTLIALVDAVRQLQCDASVTQLVYGFSAEGCRYTSLANCQLHICNKTR